jgi:hypothetical protein
MAKTLQERFPLMYTPEGLAMMKSKAPLRNPDGTPVNELAAIYIEWMKAKQIQIADWGILNELKKVPAKTEDSIDPIGSIDEESPTSIDPTIDDISEILREL